MKQKSNFKKIINISITNLSFTILTMIILGLGLAWLIVQPTFMPEFKLSAIVENIIGIVLIVLIVVQIAGIVVQSIFINWIKQENLKHLLPVGITDIIFSFLLWGLFVISLTSGIILINEYKKKQQPIKKAKKDEIKSSIDNDKDVFVKKFKIFLKHFLEKKNFKELESIKDKYLLKTIYLFIQKDKTYNVDLKQTDDYLSALVDWFKTNGFGTEYVYVIVDIETKFIEQEQLKR